MLILFLRSYNNNFLLRFNIENKKIGFDRLRGVAVAGVVGLGMIGAGSGRATVVTTRTNLARSTVVNCAPVPALQDSDADGVVDSLDAFPNEATETVDTDGDGVGDNADVFLTDSSETVDTDTDRYR